MGTLIELLASRDFTVNLLAGAVIFVVDVVLIVLLIPLVIERRANRRWAPTRRMLAFDLDRWFRTFVTLLQGTTRELDREKQWISRRIAKGESFSLEISSHWTRRRHKITDSMRVKTREHYESLLATLPIYAPSLNVALTQSLVEFVSSAEALTRIAGNLGVEDRLFWDEHADLRLSHLEGKLMASLQSVARETTGSKKQWAPESTPVYWINVLHKRTVDEKTPSEDAMD